MLWSNKSDVDPGFGVKDVKSWQVSRYRIGLQQLKYLINVQPTMLCKCWGSGCTPLGSQFYWQRKLEKTNKMSQKSVNVDGHLLGVCHTHLLPPNI
jgi:hypothetical protein